MSLPLHADAAFSPQTRICGTCEHWACNLAESTKANNSQPYGWCAHPSMTPAGNASIRGSKIVHLEVGVETRRNSVCPGYTERP